MIDESLLEFEESLSCIGNSNELLLNNMDLKVDLNRYSGTAGVRAFTEDDLLSLFSNYDYLSDQVTKCYLGEHVVGKSERECCKEFITDQKLGPRSKMETKYWMAFFDNPYKTILTLPNYTKMTMIQCGMPAQLRPLVWKRLILVSQTNQTEIPDVSLMLYKNFQHSYDKGISDQINKDLLRTFPDVEFFQQPETVADLLTILNVYANYDLDLGYCQGLLFLVGTLYHLFREPEFTFHALCKVMESEPELRSIFVPLSMSGLLNMWFDQFMDIFAQLDPELAQHLSSFCDCKVFLYQWWLSFLLINSPGMHLNQRMVDLCLLEGWKTGIFKVSLGLLVCNKPILMSFADGDEEVVYQHLLNESKWGNIVNNLTLYFTDHLSSWDAQLFAKKTPAKSHKRSATASMMDAFKTISVSASSVSGSVSRISRANRSSLTVSSGSKTDFESVYSDVQSTCSSETHRSIFEGSKLPSRKHNDDLNVLASKIEIDALALENQVLKFLLKKACSHLDEELRSEILLAVDLDV